MELSEEQLDELDKFCGVAKSCVYAERKLREYEEVNNIS